MKVRRTESNNELQKLCASGQWQPRDIYTRSKQSNWNMWLKDSSNNQDFNTEHISSSVAKKDLQVANSNINTGLPITFTGPEVPVEKEDVIQPSQLNQWKYLNHIINQLNWKDNVPIDSLIGAYCAKALEPLGIFKSRNYHPYA